MPREAKNNSAIDATLWRRLVNFWTVVLFAFVIADFFYNNGLSEFFGPVCAIYIALLAVYTAEKEFERWHDYNIGRHPGEVYVYAWTVLIIVLLGLELLHRGLYKIPTEVFTAYIVAVGILAITKKSKKTYLSKKKKR